MSLNKDQIGRNDRGSSRWRVWAKNQMNRYFRRTWKRRGENAPTKKRHAYSGYD